MCELLRPFKWEHILIPVVPEAHLELLEAPVPCIMGLNWSNSDTKNLGDLIFTQETLVVLLDKQEILHYNRNSLKKLPRLEDVKRDIANDYRIFERGRRELLINYCITEDMKRAVENIANRIEFSISRAILNYLPLIFPRTENKEINIRRIKELLLEQVKPADEHFAELFCETQMFASYVEQASKEKLKRLSLKF